jgi:hypothetical protein
VRPKQPSKQFLLVQQHVRDFLLKHPFTTILSIAHHIHQTTGIKLSTKTIGKYVHALAFSKKKAFHQTVKAIDQENVTNFKASRAAFMHSPNVFYSIDECYFSERILPSYGYSPVGTRLHSSLKPRKWDKRSLLMAVSSLGTVHYKIIPGSVKQTHFKEFLTDEWVRPDAVFLLDNVSFHRSVAKDLQQGQNPFLFTPPYSPQYNPVEYCFSKVKGYFRTLMASSTAMSLESKIEKAIQTLTPSDILRTFDHCFKI